MRLLSALYAWPAFEDANNATLLLKSLVVIGATEMETTATIQVAAAKAMAELALSEPIIVDLATAVHLIHVQVALGRFTDAAVAATEQVRQLCEMFISRKWMSVYGAVAERGGQCNVLLDEVLKGLFGVGIPVKLSVFKKYLTSVMDEVRHLNGRNDTLKSFPSFHK